MWMWMWISERMCERMGEKMWMRMSENVGLFEGGVIGRLAGCVENRNCRKDVSKSELQGAFEFITC